MPAAKPVSPLHEKRNTFFFTKRSQADSLVFILGEHHDECNLSDVYRYAVPAAGYGLDFYNSDRTSVVNMAVEAQNLGFIEILQKNGNILKSGLQHNSKPLRFVLTQKGHQHFQGLLEALRVDLGIGEHEAIRDEKPYEYPPVRVGSAFVGALAAKLQEQPLTPKALKLLELLSKELGVDAMDGPQ